MSANLPPIIRLEVDDMKYAIVHELHRHHQEVEAEVERQVEAAIANYNFASVVSTNVYKVLNNAVQSYFEYGPGARVLTQAVWDAMDEISVVAKKEKANE